MSSWRWAARGRCAPAPARRAGSDLLKIAAIIDRKRHMMEEIVEEDDPRLAKIFSREELLAMLRGV